MQHNNLIILSYHVFRDSDYAFSRSIEQFKQDLNKKVYDWITVDDMKVCTIEACDIMRECNIRAKLFLCSELIGKTGYCTWLQVKELSRYHDIECHGANHVYMDKLTADQSVKSIHKCCNLIEKHTGRRPRYFVPPYNTFNENVEYAARKEGLILLKDRITIKKDSK